MDEFDKSFNKMIKLQTGFLIVGGVLSLAVIGAVVWAAIHIAGMIWS